MNLILLGLVCLAGNHLAHAAPRPGCSGPSPSSNDCRFQAVIKDVKGFTLDLTRDKQGQLLGSDVPRNRSMPVPIDGQSLQYFRIDAAGHLRNQEDEYCWPMPPTDTLVCGRFASEQDPDFARLVGPDRWALADDGALFLAADGATRPGPPSGGRHNVRSPAFVVCPTGGDRHESKLYLDSGAQAAAPDVCKTVHLFADGCFCGRPAAPVYDVEHPPPLKIEPVTVTAVETAYVPRST